MYWGASYSDIQTKLKLKLGYVQIQFVQDFQVLAILMGKVFGGGKPEADHGQAPKNIMQAQAQLASVLGG